MPLETLTGLVERVTYHNTDNGFCVVQTKVKGKRDCITVIGNTPFIAVGEYVEAQGNWINNKEHGLQFQSTHLKTMPPNTLEGIEKYLGSGLIKGIGPQYAKRLVRTFGMDVLEVIEQHPYQLTNVNGIGTKRAHKITESWKSQSVIRDIMVFLQGHGVSTSRATRIYKTYGQEAIRVVTNNPYQLAQDIRGIGFKSADQIAQNIGIDRHALIRAQAGLNYTLLEATSDGHCGLPQAHLIAASCKLLDIPPPILEAALAQELKTGRLTLDEQDIVFLSHYYAYEKSIADKLMQLVDSPLPWEIKNEEEALSWVSQKCIIQLAENQKQALLTSLRHKVSVITGGPGTGKTTIIRALLTILNAKNVKITLCAPTGRAAKRMTESTGMPAFTIHRLLAFDPGNGKFTYHEEHTLPTQVLIIDEASMVDVPLMYAVMKALPKGAALILVGDVNQLPSVGPGQVLRDIIGSERIPVVVLNHIFRQAQQSQIVMNAHKINHNQWPVLENTPGSDFYFLEVNEADKAIEKIIGLVQTRIPKQFQCNPITDIQVLCPMQRGAVGVRALNQILQHTLNPMKHFAIEKFGQKFMMGDKVMQVENNYTLEVYNGDVGIIENINEGEQELIINFDGRPVVYEFSDLDNLTLAYATTIHKSQGSEYPYVVIPLMTQHFTMLKKNLLYTAITRGKKLVIIVGEKKALHTALRKNQQDQRISKLKTWLMTYPPYPKEETMPAYKKQ